MTKRTPRGRNTSIYPDKIANIYADLDRLDAKINQCPTDANGCVTWIHAKHRQGYGMIGVWSNDLEKKIMHTVHRLLMKRETNLDLKGQDVYHTCGNMCCVNVDHLRAGTTQDVMQTVHQNNPVILRHAATGGHRATPRNQTYQWAIEDIIAAFEGKMDRDEWSKKYNVDRARAGKLISDIRKGHAYRWARYMSQNTSDK